MTANAAIRVLTPCRSPGAELLRTLVSLSAQDIGTARQEIVLLSRSPESHDCAEARLLNQALGFRSVEVLDAAALSRSQALNLAASGGRAGTLALVPEGARLHKRFLSRCLDAMERNAAVAAFSAHTAGYADMRAAVRRRPFRPERLARENAVGPAALIRRAAWERLGGLRPGLRLAQWDLWLRLLMSGGAIAEVPELLAACPPLEALPATQDGQAKAMLVVCTPGAFEPDVCRWAMALLRGDPWAAAFEPGRIPGPRDVAAMAAGFGDSLRPDHAAWQQRRRRSA